MKKIIFLFAIAFALLSCQDEAPQTSKVINVQIKALEWQSYNDSVRSCKFYYCNSLVPELNSSVFNSGTVTAFVLDSTSEQALPYTTKAETGGTNWLRSATYSYSEGKIVFYVIYPTLNSNPPAVLNFRVVLTN